MLSGTRGIRKMSDQPQGPDWWRASDGKWYPKPPPPPNQTNPPQPGWWVASDGNWYPPQAGSLGPTAPTQWFRHPAIVVASLVFCFPIGLALLWTSKWSTNAKVGLTGAMVVLLGIGALANDDEPDTRAKGIADVVVSTSSTTVAETIIPAPTEAPTTAPPPTEPPTTLDPDIMCKTGLADPDVNAAFNACTPEQFDRLQPVVAPGRPPRLVPCQAANLGPACAGIAVTIPPPKPTSPPATRPPATQSPSAYYENCTEARNAGVTPIYRGEPGYASHLDREGDGIACE